jgi:hypothetical protein
MLQKERQFVKLPREVKRRDFYLEDIVRLAVEEGIANYSVYDEYAFHFSIDIIKKFNRKLKHLLRVSDPDAYISNSICIDTYEKDGAGFYYVGEAACYFISLLLQSKMNKKLINLEWCGHKVKPSEIPDILLRQRTRKNVPCLLFSSNRRQYVATFDHIIGLEPDEFFAELQEAQEMLKLKGENRIFVKEEFDALVGEARGISAKKT